MKNEELISIYRNFYKQAVNIAHEIIRNEISSGMTVTTKNNFDKLFEQLREYFGDIDFNQFNVGELKELGWSMWDDNLILAPTWVLDICKSGNTFTTINDEKKTKDLENPGKYKGTGEMVNARVKYFPLHRPV